MLENPMVIDSKWRHLEKEPEIVGYCDGCGDEIYEGQDVFDHGDGLVHQDSECCLQFVGNMSICKEAKK